MTHLTYNRHMSEIVMTPVTEILQTVTGSCDFDSVANYHGDTDDERRTNFWIDVIKAKSSDSGFIRLVNSYIENGWEDGSAVGWEETHGGGYITEGHHRLTLAILFGLDEIPTHPWGRSGGRSISAHHDYTSDRVNFVDF